MPGGSWAVPTFIDSEDNREAVSLTRDLTTHRKALQHRVDDSQARRALDLGGGTPRRCKPCTKPEAGHARPEALSQVFEAAMGRAEL
jgi:hypothetical protein